ncbi:cytochrome P450 [Oryctes borbonicus]|uniref:Cytochrome P450 n=1 Tax=Oryctes borbonicus TaxID=1629725 RepID=A0A0T6AYH1_9SCAR|nr:cytochrome P450 [Oryctes borbonicus]
MLTGTTLLQFFVATAATFILLIIFFKRRYSYWKNRSIEYVEPTIPFGNFKDNFTEKTSFGDCFAEFYSTVKKRKVPYAGCYLLTAPIFVPMDLDLIKRIMTTDFAHFTDHRSYVNEKDDPLSAHIFALSGQRWRDLRIKLTPTFTSGKMKLMFPIMTKISRELIATLNEEYLTGPVDAKDISARFTTDVIGNCAFGIECNSLKDPNTEFRIKGKRLINLTRFENIIIFLGMTFPNLMKFLGAPFFPKEATQFFLNITRDTTQYREKNRIRRNDALQLLIDMMRKDGDENDSGLTFNELAAQAFVFFLAGFETSSTLMSFVLYELAIHEDHQNQLRKEVNEILRENNGEITYDSLLQMRFMDMVINEALRKYPPIAVLTRVCTKDYQVPHSDITLRKGDELFISTKGIHYDPEYYLDPEKFDPFRFSEENKRKRHQFAFLPFGEGPRICIGLRFGLMQAKVGLASLIANFKFKLNPQTETPVKMDPKNFLTSALGGLWLDIEKIN